MKKKYNKYLLLFLSLVNSIIIVLLLYKSKLGINFFIINIVLTCIITYLAYIYKRINFSLVINNILLITLSSSFCITNSKPIQIVAFNLWGYLFFLNLYTLIKPNYKFEFWRYIAAPIEQFVMGLISPVFPIFSKKFKGKSEIIPIVMRIAVGAIIALPILCIFVALLASGDLVFQKIFEDIFSGYFIKDSISIVMLVIVAFWITLGILYYNFHKKRKEAVKNEIKKKRKPKLFIESMTILLLVEFLFLIYNVVQITYMFGGEKLIKKGISYSEYARSGFFELMISSIIAIILIGTLYKFTEAKNKREGIVLRVVSLFGIIELMPMLVSAFYRLYMYEDAYSFTRLRVYSHLLILYLFIILIIFAVKFLSRLKERVFIYTIQIVTYVSFIIISFINIDGFIVRANISNYEAGKTSEDNFDPGYFYLLSYDSIPNQIDYFLSAKGERKEEIAYYLESEYIELEFKNKKGADIREYNLRHKLAKNLLDENIEEIREYSEKYKERIYDIYMEYLIEEKLELSDYDNKYYHDDYDHCPNDIEFTFLNRYGEDYNYFRLDIYSYDNPNEVVLLNESSHCVDLKKGKYYIIADNNDFFNNYSKEYYEVEVTDENGEIILYRRNLPELRID